ncbi:MAG: hypothetical protein R3E97_06900 [Candidatus Eisenbacteria bacterium]
MEIDGTTVTFGAEDSGHANINDGFAFRNPGAGVAKVLFILDPATTHV